jgi:hypothetical protein
VQIYLGRILLLSLLYNQECYLVLSDSTANKCLSCTASSACEGHIVYLAVNKLRKISMVRRGVGQSDRVDLI